MYYYRREPDYKSIAMGTIAVIFILAVITWGIVECCSSREFYGVLSSKEDNTSYTYDSEHMVTSTDEDGNISISMEGDDATTAHREWVLNFYSDGNIRRIVVQRSSYTIYRLGNNAEAEAMNMLNQNYFEPALYTHLKIDTGYIVKVSGWLVDGTLEDATIPTPEKVQ